LFLCDNLPHKARSAKVESGFAPGSRFKLKKTHDLIAKPLTLWRIMRCGATNRKSRIGTESVG
jgi:hypothetical protein